ncbi:hypothetical protein N7535_008340 [Penicillium sp. DV-2018c]|nr:hypothetical protein N7535_008340 [Penicillium sp. DV-2018c]
MTKLENGECEIFAATLADIQKALTTKKPIDPYEKLPPQYHEFADLFQPKKADELPQLRGEGIDHKIELIAQDGEDPEIPWGPLYIRVSHSPAAAPVLLYGNQVEGSSFVWIIER